jgi:hypothetical protein
MSKRIVTLCILLCCAVSLTAQHEKRLRKPHVDRMEKVLLIIDAGVRALDVYSTHRALDGPNHELLLPDGIARHPVAMASTEAVTIASVWIMARSLTRHGHPLAARFLIAGDAVSDAPWAIHNLFLEPAATSTNQKPPDPPPAPIPHPNATEARFR